MEREAIAKLTDLAKNRIWMAECQMNPYYSVSKDIKLKGAYEFLIVESAKSGKKVSFAYDVEYSSRLDPKWRKSYSKEMSMKVSDLLAEWRDKRIADLLRDSDPDLNI